VTNHTTSLKGIILAMSVLTYRCGLLSLAVILAVAFSPMVIHAEPIVTEQTQYYKIKGYSEGDLGDQMNALGPALHHAYTQCQIRYQSRSKYVAGRSVITSVMVNVYVTYTMPTWTNKSDGPLALQEKWKRYYRCLSNHESGHKEISIRNARLIEQSLLGLQALSDQELQLKADEIAQAYIEKAKQEDAEYDRTTEHGKTQGAHFP
jgi:predicted secreted Zn-dependent protease